MRSSPTRRAVLGMLGSVGLLGTAGCSGAPASGRGATDVFLHNVVTRQRTVDLTVTQRGEDAPVIDRTLKMEPHSQAKINNEVLMDTDYEVRVTYTDATDEPPYAETQAWTDAGSPLRVILNDQIVFAVQVG